MNLNNVNKQPVKHVDTYGFTRWHLPNGDLHRTDGPAIIYPSGSKAWYYHGKRHRIDGPAVIRADGTKIWCHHGKLHRIDGPAVINTDGSVEYWFMDKQVYEGDFHRKLIKRKEEKC